jgi:hypothetical protein
MRMVAQDEAAEVVDGGLVVSGGQTAPVLEHVGDQYRRNV